MIQIFDRLIILWRISLNNSKHFRSLKINDPSLCLSDCTMMDLVLLVLQRGQRGGEGSVVVGRGGGLANGTGVPHAFHQGRGQVEGLWERNHYSKTGLQRTNHNEFMLREKSFSFPLDLKSYKNQSKKLY